MDHTMIRELLRISIPYHLYVQSATVSYYVGHMDFHEETFDASELAAIFESEDSYVAAGEDNRNNWEMAEWRFICECGCNFDTRGWGNHWKCSQHR